MRLSEIDGGLGLVFVRSMAGFQERVSKQLCGKRQKRRHSGVLLITVTHIHHRQEIACKHRVCEYLLSSDTSKFATVRKSVPRDVCHTGIELPRARYCERERLSGSGMARMGLTNDRSLRPGKQ